VIVRLQLTRLVEIRQYARRRLILVVVLTAFFVLGVIAPFVSGKYVIDGILDFFLIYLALAQSYDILGGLMGYVDLGITVFFGAGAYVYAILVYVEHLSQFVAIFIALLFCALIGLLVSFPMFRLKGFYFAVATLSLVPLGQYIVLAPALENLTKGVGGINGVPANYVQAYYSLFAFALFATLFVLFLSRSRFGLALTSIREDEVIAESSGINTKWVKRIAMVISATLAGMTGCLYALSQGTILPYVVFSLYQAFIPVTFALFGGTGTVIGPILGTGAYSLLDYILHSNLVQGSAFSNLTLYEQAIVGLFLIVVGLFAPDGILGLAKRSYARIILMRRANSSEILVSKNIPVMKGNSESRSE